MLQPPISGTDAAPSLGAGAGLRYGLLGLPLAFLALPLYVMLPSHYAVEHGLSLAVIGAVLLGTRLLDALLDPLIGQGIDRLFARATQLVWRLAAVSAVLVGAGFAALFFPQVTGESALLAWLVVGLTLTYLAYSVLSVIHQTWGTRLGGDAPFRARVVSWREGCALVGVLLASVLPSLAGLGATTLVLAAALWLGVACLAKAPRAERSTQQAVALGGWALPWRSGRFRALMGIFMVNGIASAVPATLVLFFVRDRLQTPSWEPLFLGVYFAAAVVSVPLWVRAVRRWGLARAWLAGMAMAVVSFAAVPWLGAGDGMAFVLVCAATGMALGADLTIPAALLTGVVQRAGHAGQAEGAYVGWWTLATKLNLALAAGLALPLLALSGYAPGVRDATALQALGWAYGAVPCILKLGAAALLWRWHRNTLGDG